jgi:hypothetical protein
MTSLPRTARISPLVIAVLVGALSAVAVATVAIAAKSAAQDRTALIRLLEDPSRDFRVRVQSAFAMGNTREAVFVAPLSRALSDSNPAVRAAAATALGRLGDRSALPALRRAARDSSAAVRMQAERAVHTVESGGTPAPTTTVAPALPGIVGAGTYPIIGTMPTEQPVLWAQARYVVMLGDMNNRSGFAGAELAQKLRSEVERNLRLVRGVAVLTTVDATAEREIRRRHLPRVRFEGNLARVERRARAAEVSVRCEVSLVLLDEPSRNMRGALNGAATGVDAARGPRGDQERRLAMQALEGAVRGAMRQAPAALAAVSR